MKKALVTVHLGRHFRIFGQYDYKVLKDMGYKVHIAANFENDIDQIEDDKVVIHQISFDRNPFSLKNIKAFVQLRKVLKNNEFEIIQTQSPSAGVITRLATIGLRKKHKKVFYTPHGYHFFKGATISRWLLFYPIEKLMGYLTDVTITINKEDFDLATKKKIGNKIEIINGVGVNGEKFYPVSRDEKIAIRNQLGLPLDKVIFGYIGELSDRKNQFFLIEAFEMLKKDYPNIHLLLVGSGEKYEELKKHLIEKKLTNTIDLLGYRNDIDLIMKSVDIVVSSSKQEGLPVNIIEAMFSGKPAIVSDCRGNRDLILDGVNGYVFEQNNLNDFLVKTKKLLENPEMYKMFSKKTLEMSEKFSIKYVENQMKKIYRG